MNCGLSEPGTLPRLSVVTLARGSRSMASSERSSFTTIKSHKTNRIKEMMNKPNISKAFSIACIFAMLLVPASADPGNSKKLRVVAYNVACGQWATPEQIGELLQPLNPDIVLLSEVPKANRGKKVKDWSLRLAEALGLGHVHVGNVSSAGHKSPKWGDRTGNYGGKFKSILSRTPLTECKDIAVEGSGWKRANPVRAVTVIGGQKFALYSLHLPGFAHHKKPRTKVEAWEGSKHKSLADHIKAEDESSHVIVGGDFNEWTDSLVMKHLLKEATLENATKEQSIDHILYSPKNSLKLIASKRDWGPKNQNKTNLKADGCLSDHPWVYAEFEFEGTD